MTDTYPQLASSNGGLPSAVLWAQLLMKDRLRPGDVAIDATLGNGHDTLFLAHQVGETGHVYGFDIQLAAVNETRNRLCKAEIDGSRFTLNQISHAHMAEHLDPADLNRVKGVMFNLGYLPGSDKSVITRTADTMIAVRQALDLLQPGGLLTVVVYPGHEGGAEEGRAIAEWAASLPPQQVEVQNLRPVNRSAAPPECWAFWKRPA